MVIGIVVAVAAVFGLGFGAGRVKHPANLKLSAVKAEVAKIEAELVADEKKLVAEAKSAYAAVVARVKSLL